MNMKEIRTSLGTQPTLYLLTQLYIIYCAYQYKFLACVVRRQDFSYSLHRFALTCPSACVKLQINPIFCSVLYLKWVHGIRVCGNTRLQASRWLAIAGKHLFVRVLWKSILENSWPARTAVNMQTHPWSLQPVWFTWINLF